MIYEIDFLNDVQLRQIKTIYNNLNFVDGSISNNTKTKYNEMALASGQYHMLNDYIEKIITSNEFIYNIMGMKKMTPLYFLKYSKGMFYDYHIDENPICGVNCHYSMTCFLNDPEEYEGGNIVLKIGNQELKYKLSKGKALIYSTGIKHKVEEVISGERNVFVCWIESAIKNSFIRGQLIDFGTTLQNANVFTDTDKFIEDLEQIRMNLMREYADF